VVVGLRGSMGPRIRLLGLESSERGSDGGDSMVLAGLSTDFFSFF
jgi:hypothetical protein